MLHTLVLFFLSITFFAPPQTSVASLPEGVVNYDTSSWFIENGYYNRYTGSNFIKEKGFICDSSKTDLAVFSDQNTNGKHELHFFTSSKPAQYRKIRITNGSLNNSSCSVYINTAQNEEHVESVNVFFVKSWEYADALFSSSNQSKKTFGKLVYGTAGSVSGITCGSGTIFTTSKDSSYFWVSTGGKVSAGKKIIGISKTQNSSVCYTEGEYSTPVTVNVVEPYGVSR